MKDEATSISQNKWSGCKGNGSQASRWGVTEKDGKNKIMRESSDQGQASLTNEMLFFLQIL